MAATKVSRTLLASASLAAAASVNATEWNLSTAYSGVAVVRLTNGASAPTTTPLVTFYVGDATGVKRQYTVAAGNTTNSSVTDIAVELGLPYMFVNVTIVNGATNAITVECFAQEATGI